MRLVLFCLAVLSSNCAVVHVAGADVSLACPAAFVNKAANPITCTVNATAVDGVVCFVNPTLIGFQFLKPTDTYTSLLCATTYPCTNPAPVTATGTCGCTRQEGGIFTFTHLFKANKTTDEGGDFGCQVCTNPVPPLLMSSSEGCTDIRFQQTTDVGSGTTDSDADSNNSEPTDVGSGTTDGDADSNNSGNDDSNSSSNLGLIIGATAGGVLVVAMATGTAVWCSKKRSSGGQATPGPSNTRSDTPPPAVGTASPPADRGLVATSGVQLTEEEEAGENASDASEASEATDVSGTSEEP